MKSIKKLFILSFVLIMMLFGFKNVLAEENDSTTEKQYTITIDANGGIAGKDFQDTIVLGEDETVSVNGTNEDFLKAPEGKGFSGIEIIEKDGTVETQKATGVLLWGDDYHDGMTLKFHWGDIVSDVNLTLKYPTIGEGTDTPMNEYGYHEVDEQTNKPNVTAESNYGLTIDFLEWVDKDSFNEEYEYFESPFIGTFESGKTYYALVDLSIDNINYAFNKSNLLNINVNGKTGNIYKVGGDSTYIYVALEVAPYEVIEGANQKVENNADAEFEIDADYSLFKDGGKVYIDDATEPLDPSNYTSKEGSTIITLKKEYLDTLSEGEHTLKVVFNDNNSAVTSFTLTKTSSKEETNKNTEKETEPPHTAVDNTINSIMIHVSILVLSLVGLAGTISIKRKRLN